MNVKQLSGAAQALETMIVGERLRVRVNGRELQARFDSYHPGATRFRCRISGRITWCEVAHFSELGWEDTPQAALPDRVGDRILAALFVTERYGNPLKTSSALAEYLGKPKATVTGAFTALKNAGKILTPKAPGGETAVVLTAAGRAEGSQLQHLDPNHAQPEAAKSAAGPLVAEINAAHRRFLASLTVAEQTPISGHDARLASEIVSLHPTALLFFADLFEPTSKATVELTQAGAKLAKTEPPIYPDTPTVYSRPGRSGKNRISLREAVFGSLGKILASQPDQETKAVVTAVCEDLGITRVQVQNALFKLTMSGFLATDKRGKAVEPLRFTERGQRGYQTQVGTNVGEAVLLLLQDAKGYSDGAISRALGCDPAYVHQVAVKHGLRQSSAVVATEPQPAPLFE